MGLRMSGEERRLEQIDGSATQVRGAAAVLEACQASHSPPTMTDAHDCLPRTNRPDRSDALGMRVTHLSGAARR